MLLPPDGDGAVLSPLPHRRQATAVERQGKTKARSALERRPPVTGLWIAGALMAYDE